MCLIVAGKQSVVSNVFIGLAAVAGFLVIVFTVVLTRGLLKRKRNEKRFGK